MGIAPRDQGGIALQTRLDVIVGQRRQDGQAAGANAQRVAVSWQQDVGLQRVIAVFTQHADCKYVAPQRKEG
ncbi:hypothetical protein D9M68_817170 [compost metagenome]